MDDDEEGIALGLSHNVQLHRGLRRSGHAFAGSRLGYAVWRFEALLTRQEIKNFRPRMSVDRTSNSLFVSRSHPQQRDGPNCNRIEVPLLQRNQHLNHTLPVRKRFQSLAHDGAHKFASVRSLHRMSGR